MEVREFAERVLLSADLSIKLTPPTQPLTDELPGRPERIDLPVRSADLRFVYGKRGAKMPQDGGLVEPRLRGVAHHVMANHELQALEIMAWVLIAFPDAPRAFRRGLVQILIEEQQHTRWHMERCSALGLPFGSIRVAGYVWRRAQKSASVLDYLACLPLTFEAANLDHSLHYAACFAAAGDEAGAAVMHSIHQDEIRHVGFGVAWLRRLKQADQTDWDAYVEHLQWPLRPEHASGKEVDLSSRRAAGMDEEFVGRLQRHAMVRDGRGVLDESTES